MSEPVLLDLFCCGGGATKGYQRAGFRVVGVDIDPQPDYCGDDFVQADALDYLAGHGMKYDAIHASPPCQASTALTKGTNAGREYPQLIPATRAMLAYYRVPTVLENVQGSDLRRDLVLCGEMFGLGVIRHRYFEISGFDAVQPAHKPHRGRVRGWRHGQYHDGPYVAVYGDGGGKGSVPEWQQAMGIDWTSDRKTIAEAIPPAFTEHIGRQIMAHIQGPALMGMEPAPPTNPEERQPMSTNQARALTELLLAQGWQHQPTTAAWRYYAGVEVYEIRLATTAGGKVSHASLWDLTAGQPELIASAYRATPPGRRLQEIRAWAEDPAPFALKGTL